MPLWLPAIPRALRYWPTARRRPQRPLLPTPNPTRPTGAADRRLRYTTNLTGSQQSLLDSLVFTFERPLRTFDSTQLSLHTDSTFTPVTAYTTELDSSRKSLALHTAWQPGASYHLILNPGFAEDTLGHRLPRRDTLSFAARKLEDYGRIQPAPAQYRYSQNPVLLFVQGDKVVFSAPVKNGVFTNNLFTSRRLRPAHFVRYQRQWRMGSWQLFRMNKRQPEIVRPFSEKITVKPAWDNEFERSLAIAFLTLV